MSRWPVPGGQGVDDDLLGLVGRDLKDAEAEDRHLHVVVQSDLRDLDRHGETFPSHDAAIHQRSQLPSLAAQTWHGRRS